MSNSTTDQIRTLCDLIDLHTSGPKMIPEPFRKFTPRQCAVMVANLSLTLIEEQAQP